MKLLCIAVLLLAGPAYAEEADLLATLRSSGPPEAKSQACRELA